MNRINLKKKKRTATSRRQIINDLATKVRLMAIDTPPEVVTKPEPPTKIGGTYNKQAGLNHLWLP